MEGDPTRQEVVMLGRGVLSRLHTLTQQKTHTLTVYVDIDQNKQSNRKRGYLVQAEAMLKELRLQHGRSQRLDAAAERALDLIRSMRPSGKSALVVVHPDTDLAEIHQAGLPFAAAAYWHRGAFLRPVVEAMDENERYGVVLTDNKRARLFTAQMGELTEHEDLLSDTSQRTRGVGPDQWRAQKRHDARHQEEVALHAKRVIDALHDLSLRAPFDRLIVAGPPQATGQLVRLLPKRLSGKLVETVSMRVSADRKEVLNKILAVQRRMEREQESKLVEGLVAELHDSGKAVAEFASVLDAVNQGRVWKLFYAKGLRKEGGECKECGAYLPHAVGPCVYCDGGVQPLAQVIDRLSQTVMEMGGQVEVVDGPAAEQLKPLGSIAALLRY
jgi:protein required for attachment to host cells